MAYTTPRQIQQAINDAVKETAHITTVPEPARLVLGNTVLKAVLSELGMDDSQYGKDDLYEIVYTDGHNGSAYGDPE